MAVTIFSILVAIFILCEKSTAAVRFLKTKQQSTGKWRWHSPVVHSNYLRGKEKLKWSLVFGRINL